MAFLCLCAGDRFTFHLPKKLIGKKRYTCYLSCTPDLRQMLITKMKDDKSYVYTTAVSMQTLQILDVVAVRRPPSPSMGLSVWIVDLSGLCLVCA